MADLTVNTTVTQPLLADGRQGYKGWSPLISNVADGDRIVQQITDWTGGQGIKPATGKYIGAEGLVTDIADAVDIRGPIGETGGIEGTGVTRITVSATPPSSPTDGAYNVTGITANILRALILSANFGSSAVTGYGADILAGFVVIAGSGAQTISGQDASFQIQYILDAEYGTYDWTGFVAAIAGSAETTSLYVYQSGTWVPVPASAIKVAPDYNSYPLYRWNGSSRVLV